MSKLNYHLLYELTHNVRKPLLSIGKRIKCSQQYVSYNVNLLYNNDDVLGNYVLFDHARFGYLTFSVYFKNIYIDNKKFQGMLGELKKNESVTSIYELGGQWDLFVEFSTTNPSRFNKVLKELIMRFPEYFHDYMILIDVVKHIYPRKYLVKKRKFDLTSPDDDIIIGGDRDPITLSADLLRLCRELMKNPREQIVKLSNTLGVSAKTCIKRMKFLESSKIIRGFRGVPNFSNLNLISNRIFIRLDSSTPEKEKSVMSYIRLDKNIVQCTKTMGKWDMIIDVETFTDSEFRKTYLRLREKFKEIIKDADTSPIYSIQKKEYLPISCFDDL